MSRDCGGLRNAAGLERADGRARPGSPGAGRPESGPGRVGGDEPALRGRPPCSSSARLREESRGAHWRDDFGERRESWQRHLVVQTEDDGLVHRLTPVGDAGRTPQSGSDAMSVRITGLAEAEAYVASVGLDVAALAVVVAEALGEDLGGRGVLAAGHGQGRRRHVGRHHRRRRGRPRRASWSAARAWSPGCRWRRTWSRSSSASVVEPRAPVRGRGARRRGRPGRDRRRPGHAWTGAPAALLTAERVALNLLTLTSGVATATRAWVDALAGTGTRVRDTRKTTPGLRMLEKYAVRVGGGVNHRMSLADAALVKDNHVLAAGGVVPAYERVRAMFPDLWVQVEVTTPEQARAVVDAGATDLLLDNMSLATMTEVVAELGGPRAIRGERRSDIGVGGFRGRAPASTSSPSGRSRIPRPFLISRWTSV